MIECLICVAVGYFLCAITNGNLSFRNKQEAKKQELTEEEKREQEQLLREYQNFMTYTGDAQE